MKTIKITKITSRTNEEKTNSGKLERIDKICETLDSCFENNSLDQEDEEAILRWACRITNPRNLIYTLEKIKFSELSKS